MDAAPYLVADHLAPSFGLFCASSRLEVADLDCDSCLEEETYSADRLALAKCHCCSLVILGRQNEVRIHHLVEGLEVDVSAKGPYSQTEANC